MADNTTVNPYAPMATSDGPVQPRQPRWPAVLLSLLAVPLAGAGLLILRQSRRDLIWVATSLALLAVYGFTPAAPRVALAAIVVLGCVWFAGFVVTCAAARGEVQGVGRTIIGFVAILAAAYGVKLGVRAFLVEAFQIPSAASIPTLLIGDHILVNKWVRHPARGDMIVFKYPRLQKVDYVKRVIGLPGETIALVNNQVIIDGQPLPRRALADSCTAEGRACHYWQEQGGNHGYRVLQEDDRPPANFGPVKIPPNALFVMGDNRDNSNDSRVWGTVPVDLVKGTATATYFSKAPTGEIRWERIAKPID
jgi:signal peptidase I